MLESATPVIRLVAPGPKRTERSGRVARQSTIDFRHKRGALLMARQNELDLRRCFERHHEIGVFFTRYAKNVFNSLFFQAFDEQIGCFHGLASMR